MGIIRLGVCLLLDTAFTVATGGAWLPVSSIDMGGCFTAKEMRYQREKEVTEIIMREMRKKEHGKSK